MCKHFAGGIGHGQQHAVFLRQHPAQAGQRHFKLVADRPDIDVGVIQRDEHTMVQLDENAFYDPAQDDEIDDVLTGIWRPSEFDRNMVIVPVQRFALAALERNEVRCAEKQIVVGKPDGKVEHGKEGVRGQVTELRDGGQRA